uniref:Uncharacterized protein n=1 Tax=Arundo donax TaxID=35708 RepID=A0A0A9DPD5_ARUDO
MISEESKDRKIVKLVLEATDTLFLCEGMTVNFN